MANDTISVIIPVYNTELYLNKCIESVINQTYQNLEIILVDDGSTDKSGEICDEYAQKDSRVKVIHKVNGGVSSARNLGLDATKGTYITFVDADDFILSHYIEALYNDMSDDVDIVRCEAEIFLPNGEKDTCCQREKTVKAAIVLDALDSKNFTRYSYWEVWAALYKRSAIGDLRFNTAIHNGEDILFYYSALKRCHKIKYTVSTTYCYVQNQGSVMHSTFSEKHYTEVYAWHDICRLYTDSAEISEILKERYINICCVYLDEIRYYGINNADEKINFLKHEIRQYLPQSLKLKNCSRSMRVKFILYAFLDEKCLLLLKKTYRRLKRKTV